MSYIPNTPVPVAYRIMADGAGPCDPALFSGTYVECLDWVTWMLAISQTPLAVHVLDPIGHLATVPRALLVGRME